MQYIILHANGFVDLEKIVERWIGDGWQPQGGVSVVHIPPDGVRTLMHEEYAQAMVKGEIQQGEVVIRLQQQLDEKQVKHQVYQALKNILASE